MSNIHHKLNFVKPLSMKIIFVAHKESNTGVRNCKTAFKLQLKVDLNIEGDL